MAGKDQERFEEYLALERYIEALRAGRVAPIPAELTPELARIYGMAMLFHAASSGAAAPRPAFVAELEARLTHEEARQRAPLQGYRSRSAPKEWQAPPRVSRRALLRTGAVVAASLSVGAGIDHVLQARQRAAITAAQPTAPSWLPLVPDDIPTTRHLVTTLDQLGEQPVPFRAGGIVGYLMRNTGESSDPSDGLVIALSAACMHMGCLVNWEGSTRTFRCPCHAGVFTAFDKTDTTPAMIHYLAPLPRLATTIDEGGHIFVRVPSQTSSIPF